MYGFPCFLNKSLPKCTQRGQISANPLTCRMNYPISLLNVPGRSPGDLRTRLLLLPGLGSYLSNPRMPREILRWYSSTRWYSTPLPPNSRSPIWRSTIERTPGRGRVFIIRELSLGRLSFYGDCKKGGDGRGLLSFATPSAQQVSCNL